MFLNHDVNAQLSNNTFEINNVSIDGGGVYANNNSSVTNEQSRFILNTAGRDGAGLYLNPTINSVVTECLFDRNIAQNGGGVFINQGTAEMSNCTFVNNQVSVAGGGVFINFNTVIDVNNILIQSNYANLDGGGMFINNAEVQLSAIHFLRNTCDNNGGALYLNDAITSSTPVFTNCLFEENYAKNGGGIFSNAGTIEATHNTFNYNQASENGGGIFVNFSQFTLSTIQFLANSSTTIGNGGALFVNSYSGTVLNDSSFVENIAGYGGAIFTNLNGVVSLIDSLVEENEASIVGGAVFNEGQLSLTGINIIRNNRTNITGSASGIYNGGLFYIQDYLIDANGLYIADRPNVAYITAPLIERTVIQLDLTNYVTPNIEGNPIVVGESTSSYPVLVQQDANAFVKPTTEFEDWEIQLSNDSSQVLLVKLLTNTITYNNLLGATNPNPQTYNESDLPIILSPPGPVRGYRFLNWYDLNGKLVTEIPPLTNGELILYARWVPAPETL